MDNPTVDLFLREFVDWARSEDNILALGLVGSQARGTAGPDSDVDLLVLARDPLIYLQDTNWNQRFGVVERQQVEDYGRIQSLRVFYRNGPEVEYGIGDAGWAALPMDPGTRRVVSGGLRVLWERTPLLSRLLEDS
jgi:predicted nucleotidyltransferase